MSFRGKEWIWPEPEKDQGPVLKLAGELNIAPALARLLLNRGISDPGQARAFLSPEIDQMHAPLQMLGMKQAVERILKGIELGEKITVHGDYDADGISASVIMVEVLRNLGADVDFFLPSRFEEGYGLHAGPLRQFKDNGTNLVITVDCGINAADEIAYALSIGLDIIITDHHQPLEKLSGPAAVINPLQEGCNYPFKELSGAGIAFKLAAALCEGTGRPFPENLLDLAALGTAADVVPLLGENRVIVATGLQVLQRLERVGFKALAEAVSLQREKINSTALSFIFAPAINAAGRMGEALPAAELLLETDFVRAAELADRLNRTNQERRTREQEIVKEAEAAAFDLLDSGDRALLTIAADNWHHGVIGIVASRLVEKFNRPVALVALENGEGRGSARSVPGFDITAALAGSAGLLERFGGHDQAAGFTVKRENVEALREGLNNYAIEKLGDKEFNIPIYIETELDHKEIDNSLAKSLEKLHPLGTANPAPLFASRSWELLSWRTVGADQSHLKLNFRKDGKSLAPIYFSGADLEPKLEKGRRLDLVFRLKNGYFRDRETLDVEIKDLAYSDQGVCRGIRVIDRRGCSDREKCLKEIMAESNGNTAIFTSTVARRQKLEKLCPASDGVFYFSSGRNSGAEVNLLDASRVVLYDLPLYSGILQPLVNSSRHPLNLTFHLLYGTEDLKINNNLLNLSLPTESQLRSIVEHLKTLPTGTIVSETEILAGLVSGLKPGATFMANVLKILVETGITGEQKISTLSAEVLQLWPGALEESQTYRELTAKRAEFSQFQQELLEDNPAEIAAYFASLCS
jgi:single-stranded-DNA-specific exonuclease